MPQGPKRLEVPTVDDLAIEREIVFVIRLREDVLIGITGDFYRLLVDLRQLAIGEGEAVARLSDILFYDILASLDLIV